LNITEFSLDAALKSAYDAAIRSTLSEVHSRFCVNL
jgi:hypothetical protein